MLTILQLVSRMPLLPAGVRLSLQRSLMDRAYAQDIAIARKANDKAKVESLESDRRFEVWMHDEEEDAHLTDKLMSKARRLRVPIPHRYNNDKSESEFWYEGQYTGRWYLTANGVVSLREEIRKELRARYELRSQWVAWLSGLTGVIGTVMGLIALLMSKSP